MKLAKLSALLIGLALCFPPPAQAQTLYEPRSQQEYSLEEIADDLATANPIYLGETHDDASDRVAQLQIIQTLYDRDPNIAIGMEMFQRPYQSVLDAYIAGEITEDQLLEQSEYNTRWGYDWDSYAPLLRFARDRQIPVLALSAPSELTRKVATNGWESLSEAERQQLPPLEEIHTDNEDYRQRLYEIYEAHLHGGHGNAEDFDRFFFVQVLWDETMAETIAHFLQSHPNYQVIAIAGAQHIIGGDGIPDRVARRIPLSDETSSVPRSILLYPQTELEAMPAAEAADYFWQF